MPLIRGLTRGLWRTLTSQGAQLPLDAELRTPIQTVQLVDDVSNTVTKVPSPNGFVTCVQTGAGVTIGSLAGIRWTAGDGGLMLNFDPGVSLLGLSAGTSTPITPTLILGSVLRAELSGVPARSHAELIEDTPANRSNHPAFTFPTAFLPDWFHVPPGNQVELFQTVVNLTITQTFQYREALGS